MTTNKAIILAAGCGTRMGLNTRPKVLREVGGMSMLQIVVSKAFDFDDIVVVVSGEMLDQYYDKLPKHNLIRYVEQKERLGTCNALMEGLSTVQDGNLLVLYGDSPFIEKETIDAAMDLLKKGTDLVLVGFDCSSDSEYGKLVLESPCDSIVVDIKEGVLSPGLCNSGVLAASVEFFRKYLPEIKEDAQKKEFFLTDIVKISRQDGKVTKYIKCCSSEGMGVNTHEDLLSARSMMNEKIVSKLEKAGVDLLDASSIKLAADIDVGSGSVIEPFCVFGPNVKIGKGCRIGSFCDIKNVLIEDGVTIESNVVIAGGSYVAKGSTIKSFSHLEGASLNKNCVVGPFARVRPEVNIGDGSKVGSFVEVKKSKLGKNVKINHLSYIGDAEVGDNTNIGAGVVVCNYDGFAKHSAKIGKNVFVGSQTTIVSPVEIGDDVVLGSRCLARKNIEAGSFVAPKIESRSVPSGAARFRRSKEAKRMQQA